MNQKVLIYLETNHCLSSSFPLLELSSTQTVIYLFILSIYQDEAENAYKKASSHIYSGLYLHHWTISRIYFMVNVASTCRVQAVKTKLTA